MKKYLIFLVALVNVLVACNNNEKEEIIFPNETKAFINKEVFTPSKSVAVKAGLLVGGVEIDMQNNPDLVPVIAILALFAESEIVLRHINRLQIKESDRLKGIITAFELIGAEYICEDDYLKVSPLQNEPGVVTLDTQNDHRLVMAFTLLQLHFPQISLSEGKSVVKSCPEFYPELASLKKLNS